MVIVLSLCILVMIVFFVLMVNSCSAHKRLLEGFNEEMYIDMTDADKNLYFNIIDMFKEVLGRGPSIDELYSEYRKIKGKTHTMKELRTKLETSDEYKRMLTGDEYYKAFEDPDESKKAFDLDKDTREIKKVIGEVMPLIDADEMYDDKHIAFLLMKYKSFNKDNDRLKNYLLLTPEYSQYCETFDKRDAATDTLNKMAPYANTTKGGEMGEPFEEDVEEEYDVTSVYLNDGSNLTERRDSADEVVPILSSSKSSTPMSFQLTESDKQKRIKLKQCSYDDEFTNILNKNKDPLSKFIMKRNMDGLMYHCGQENHANKNKCNKIK